MYKSLKTFFGVCLIMGGLMVTVPVSVYSQEVLIRDQFSGSAKPSSNSVQLMGDVFAVMDMTTGQIDALTMAQSILGAQANIQSATYTGNSQQAGFYDRLDLLAGQINPGLVFSSGRAADAVGTNTVTSNSGMFLTPGDPDFDILAGLPTDDASILSISFIPTTTQISFNYVFGSEEYPEFVDTEFNDAAAIFVNGVNCALVNGNPLTVNAVNANVNSANYIDNLAGNLATEMDGFTRVLSCTAALNVGVVNTLKIGVADTADTRFDSWFFLEANLPPLKRIGDLVWIDPDQNNIYNVGEVVVPNVPVQIYRDDGNGIFEPGVDPLVNSTVTNVNGVYGYETYIPGDYWVIIDTSTVNATPRVTRINGPLAFDDVENLDIDFPLDLRLAATGDSILWPSIISALSLICCGYLAYRLNSRQVSAN